MMAGALRGWVPTVTRVRRWRPSRPSVPVAVALLSLAISLLPIVALLLGTGTGAGWIHRWCSPGALGAAGGGLGHEVLRALEVHWPHFLPGLLGLGTLVYLRRADRRHREGVGAAAVDGGVRRGPATLSVRRGSSMR